MTGVIGWTECFLEDIGDIVTGKTPSTKDKANFGGSIPFVKPGDLDSGGYIGYTVDTLSEKGFSLVPRLPKDAIMVTCIGNLGKVGITTRPSATNQQINSIILNKDINSKYLYHYFSTMQWWLEQEASATTVSIINKGKFSKAPIKLPPIAEQQQIVAKLDELLAQVDTLKTRLDTIPKILKRFRQSVLSAAVRGRLTEDWRIENPGFFAEALISMLIEANVHKAKPYDPGTIPYQLPKQWQWVRLGDVFTLKSGRTISEADELESGVYPYFKIGDMNSAENAFYMNSTKRYIDETTVNEKSLLPKNTIIFPKRGGAIATNKKRILNVVSLVDLNTMGLIVTEPMSVMFVYRWFSTLDLSTLNTGSTIPQINNGDIEPLWVPIPSCEEQTEIVTRVEHLFSYADQIEQRVKDAQARVNHLTQAILAKAFRGELTADWREQNPGLISGENSAEALLAKIKTERQTITTTRQTRRKEKA